ncbi:hypothetical protein A3K64_04435 [Candidatus Micrarchaeota archaeon RBG_16_36_9]|nr:MAG: hypothetical protein A3K64_04435 [Candidatus Micrarchaeota archaeon RBG_16_36_9]
MYDIKREGMAFSVTVPEIIRFYGIEYLRIRKRSYSPPPHLKWFGFYLHEIINEKRKGDSLSIGKKIKPGSVRASRYNGHWIALTEDERGLPCYLPLGLHIPKEQNSPLSI